MQNATTNDRGARSRMNLQSIYTPPELDAKLLAAANARGPVDPGDLRPSICPPLFVKKYALAPTGDRFERAYNYVAEHY